MAREITLPNKFTLRPYQAPLWNYLEWQARDSSLAPSRGKRRSVLALDSSRGASARWDPSDPTSRSGPSPQGNLGWD